MQDYKNNDRDNRLDADLTNGSGAAKPGRLALRLLLSAAAILPSAVHAQTTEPAGPVSPAPAASSPPAQADDQSTPQQAASPQQTAPDEAAGTALGDIVVTATKRSSTLQRVSATVVAVPAASLKAFKVDGLLQLPSLVSGLAVVPTGANNVYLRGIGTFSTGYNEAQTAVYIDGVYLANPATGIFSFNNIDRIEVLKGPQGTLYGRNATAGLISVITHNPSDTFKLDAVAGYGNYQTFTGSVYLSVPITDNLAANVSVYRQKQAKGWSHNIFLDTDNQKTEETAVQSKVLWTPTPTTTVTTDFIYDFNNRDLGYTWQPYPGTIGTDGTQRLGKYVNAERQVISSPFRGYIGSLKVEQDLGFASLSSLAAYQTSHAPTFFGSTDAFLGNPIKDQSLTYNNFYGGNRTFTEELQLTSASNQSRLSWILGAFYLNDHTKLVLDQTTTCVGTVCTPGYIPTHLVSYPNTFSYSGYADATYRFFSATRLTLGLRYTDEKKTLSGSLAPLQGLPNSAASLPVGTATFPGQPFTVKGVTFPGIDTELHSSKLTYRVVLAQDITNDIHAFASYNLGFKSAAFNAQLFTNEPVKPELLYSTEVGVKSEFFDHRLRFNLSYFHYNYKDVQLRSVAPPAPAGNSVLLNAARVRINGVDVDFALVPVHGLTISGSAEFLRSRFVDYPGASCTTPTVSMVNGVLVGKAVSTTCNQAGFVYPTSPRFSSTVGAVYNLDTGIGMFSLSINDRYSSSYFYTSDNTMVSPPRNIVDSSLGWTSTSKRLDAQLWVRNLTGEYYFAHGQVSTNYAVVPGPPRTFGFTIGYHI